MSHTGKLIGDNYILPEDEIYEDYTGQNIIFLDVDGVLNCIATKNTVNGFSGVDETRVIALRHLYDIMSPCKIVLTSTWKEHHHKAPHKDAQDVFANALDTALEGVGLQISDKTIDRNGAACRGKGILDFLAANSGHGRFIILDDETFDFKTCGLRKYQIQTTYYKQTGGLQEKHLKQAKRILERQD